MLTLCACAMDDAPFDDAVAGGDAASPVADATKPSPDAPTSPDGSVGGDAGAHDVRPVPSTDAGADPPGVFVAVGYGGRTIRSVDDGRTWVDDHALIANGVDDKFLLRTVVWGGGKFVALGWRAMTSTDGATWTDLGLTGVNWIGAARHGNGAFVGVGGYGLRAASPDGLKWTGKSIDTAASHSVFGLAFSGITFVSCNDDGARAYSADGNLWAFSGGSTTRSSGIALGNGVFVAIGGPNVLRSTDDGRTFQDVATLATAAGNVIFAQGHFTALGDGHIFTSSDGLTWNDHIVPGDQRGPVAYGHGTYVRLGAAARMRSSDGLTWTSASSSAGPNHLMAIAFGPK